MIFAPLHIISCYSFLQSGLTIERIKASVSKENYFGAAITDKKVMYGIPFFIKAMEEINKKSLIGLALTIEEVEICLYALNEEGYRNLCLISTHAEQSDLTFDNLKDYKEGIFAIIDTNKGKFKEEFSLLEKEDSSFNFRLNKIYKTFDELYLGVEVTSREEVKYANKVRSFANEHGYTTIAFPTISYQKKDDAIVLTMVKAIKDDDKIDIKKESGQAYFMKESDYQKIYTSRELALTVELMKKANFNYHQKRGEMLHFPVENSEQYLREQVAKGLARKGFATDIKYLERANHEVDVILKMGYADYFLIVQDYVLYAKNHGILVGSGRGSAAGSLVSYALDITSVDPIKYDLQFERFLNEGRKTMPDIDIDFMDIRRDEMVEYMRHKYGVSKVANIVTFQTIGAKQSLRDVGRIYEYHDWLITNLSKAITDPKLSLRECYKTLPAFKALVDSDNYYLEIVSLASKIEGLPRQSGLHAAGVVLNNSPIEEAMPISFDFSNNYISQYEMHFLEEQGFLKMDFLALRNLTIVDNCLKLIKKYKNIHIDFNELKYDDPLTYQIINSGKVMGLFQLESAGMKRAAKILEPTCFNDVVALISLFRPGPMDSIPSYGRRKKGLEKVPPMPKAIEEVLGPTYGILVYQEQINSLAKVMAGFSLSEADLFRRGVSKKDAKVLKSQKEKFITGSIKNGYSEKVATEMYNRIYKFANYGFNKSHAVGYAILGCQMAYLKAKFPLEFYASILQTNASTNDTKFGEIVSEMKSLGLEVGLPDINLSEAFFSIRENKLIYPLSEIRGVPSVMVESILIERNKGAFKDFFEFILRMYGYRISEKQIEALINAGAFDALCPSRNSLRNSIFRGMQYAELNFSDNGQMNLGSEFIKAPSIIEKEDNPLENLNLEYDTIGIMLSDNPLKYKKDILLSNNALPIVEVIDSTSFVTFGGMIKAKKVIKTKKGTPMAFVKVFDDTGEMEVTIFSDLYSKNMKFIETNNLVLIKGSNRENKGETSFIVNEIISLED
ncbi:MAG: DNA polymerase III subunit alpha [Bacilli bacterium]|nr:DNA polymerase III subunit alpha [Bacilli bacterium]